MKFKNLPFFIYTNKENLPLAEIAADKLLQASPESINLSIVTNKIKENFNPKYKNLYFLSNIDRNDGYQFSDTVRLFLENIDSEYVFLLCDDYMTTSTIKENEINNILSFLKKYKVDYICFQKRDKKRTEKYKEFYTEEYGNNLHIVPDSETCRFSVQPSIWKTSVLKELLNSNNPMDVHVFEQLKPENKYLTLGVNWHNLTDNPSTDPSPELKFVYNYVEVVRHGVFYFYENGFPISKNSYLSNYIRKLINEYKMNNNDLFKKVISKITDY